MAFIFKNPNPKNNLTGDCVIRAISIVENKDWDDIFLELTIEAYMMKDIVSSNNVWSNYLWRNGYERMIIPNTCPDCYSINQFAKDYSQGTYLLATGTHVVAVKDGNYFDTWDSGNEIPIYYWRKEE